MKDAWLDRERRTAGLVRACYSTFVAPGRPTAEQIYALCKLTWITKGGDNDIADNTSAAVAPALSALVGTELLATTPAELVRELQEVGVPAAVASVAARPLGFVNFYAGFRNIAKLWLIEHWDEVSRIVQSVAESKDGSAVRSAYEAVDSLPPLPRPRGGDGKPRSLLTPLLACLDERGRGPIINDRKLWLLSKLGLKKSSLVEQYDGLVGLIGQAAISDAFALDRADEEQIEKAMRRVPRRSKPGQQKGGAIAKPLGERHDEDVEFLRTADAVKMRRIHNSMTNALRTICTAAGLEIKEGSKQTCLFDALVREYQRTERHLLIEVKTDDSAPMCRMAVGQLLDYRRQHGDRAAIDLAVLFPAKPSKEALAFLAFVDVQVLWLDRTMEKLSGGLRLGRR